MVDNLYHSLWCLELTSWFLLIQRHLAQITVKFGVLWPCALYENPIQFPIIHLDFPFGWTFAKIGLPLHRHHRAWLNRGTPMGRSTQIMGGSFTRGLNSEVVTFSTKLAVQPSPLYTCKQDGSLLFLISQNGFTPLFRSSSMTIIEYKFFGHLTPDCKIHCHSSSFDYFWYTQASSILASYG